MTVNKLDLSCHCFKSPNAITNGQPVSQQTIDPVISQLYANDLYLKDILDYFEMPSALLRCVPCNPAVQVGQPLYYSDASSRFELAQYASVVAPSGHVFLEESAEVWGIAVKRESADEALLAISGLYPVDLSAAVDGPVVTGKYYLDVEEGKLNTTPPDDVAPVYVCTTTDSGLTLLRPWSGEHNGIVLQWRHSLTPVALGQTQVTSGVVSITSPVTNTAGWLPADHGIFDGNAPQGAKFGYVIPNDNVLESRWPPRFLSSVHVEFDRGLDAGVSATSVPVGEDGLVLVDSHGIWWMSDCENNVPFDLTGAAPADVAACPPELGVRVTLYAARPGGVRASELGKSSLQSTHPGIKIYGRDTTENASHGHLDIKLSLEDAVHPSAVDTGGTAIKSIDNERFILGPATSRVKPGAGIHIAGAEGDSNTGFYGDITVSSHAETINELLPQTTELRRATEGRFYSTLGIVFPNTYTSGVTSTFIVPTNLAAPVELELLAWLSPIWPNGEDPGAEDEPFTVTVTRLPRPDDETSLMTLSEVSLTFPDVYPTDRAVREYISSTFTAYPGDVLYVAIDRPNVKPYSIVLLKHLLRPHTVGSGDNGGGSGGGGNGGGSTSTTDDPSTSESSTSDPSTSDPGTGDPSTEESTTAEHIVSFDYDGGDYYYVYFQVDAEVDEAFDHVPAGTVAALEGGPEHRYVEYMPGEPDVGEDLPVLLWAINWQYPGSGSDFREYLFLYYMPSVSVRNKLISDLNAWDWVKTETNNAVGGSIPGQQLPEIDFPTAEEGQPVVSWAQYGDYIADINDALLWGAIRDGVSQQLGLDPGQHQLVSPLINTGDGGYVYNFNAVAATFNELGTKDFSAVYAVTRREGYGELSQALTNPQLYPPVAQGDTLGLNIPVPVPANIAGDPPDPPQDYELRPFAATQTVEYVEGPQGWEHEGEPYRRVTYHHVFFMCKFPTNDTDYPWPPSEDQIYAALTDRTVASVTADPVVLPYELEPGWDLLHVEPIGGAHNWSSAELVDCENGIEPWAGISARLPVYLAATREVSDAAVVTVGQHLNGSLDNGSNENRNQMQLEQSQTYSFRRWVSGGVRWQNINAAFDCCGYEPPTDEPTTSETTGESTTSGTTTSDPTTEEPVITTPESSTEETTEEPVITTPESSTEETS